MRRPVLTKARKYYSLTSKHLMENPVDKKTEAMWTIIAIIIVIHLGLFIAGQGRIHRLFESQKGETIREFPIYTWGKVAVYNLGSITVVAVVEVCTYFLLAPFFTSNPMFNFAI